MILYREEMTNVIQRNVLLLELAGGDYLYVSQNTYDQALLLYDRFEGEKGVLNRTIGEGSNKKEYADFFFENAPEPICILAPFLNTLLCDMELKLEMRMLCGVLHQMSQTIDFNSFVNVPKEVRAKVKFSKTTLVGYEKSWDDILLKLRVEELEDTSIQVIRRLLAGSEPMKEKVFVPTKNSIEPKKFYPQTESGDVEIGEAEAEEAEDNTMENVAEDPWEAFNARVREGEEKAAQEEKESEDIIETHEEEPAQKEMSLIDRITEMYGGMD